MKKLRLAELTSKLVGTPYKLGGRSVSEGLDCYSLFAAVCEFWGARAPVEFDGLTFDNYPERFQSDPEGTKETMFRALAAAFKEIHPAKAFVGDVLVTTVKGGDTGKFGIGIHAGGGSMLASYLEKGVRVMPLRAYNIVKAYRVV